MPVILAAAAAMSWIFYFSSAELGIATEGGGTKWYGLDSLVVVNSMGPSRVFLGFESGTCVFEDATYRQVKRWIAGNRHGRYFRLLPSGELINLLYIDGFEEVRRYSRCDGEVYHPEFTIHFKICSSRCNEHICDRLSVARKRGIRKVSAYTYNKIIGDLDEIDPGSGDIWRRHKTKVVRLCPKG